MRWGAVIVLVCVLLLVDAIGFNGRYRARLGTEALRAADVIGAEIGKLVRNFGR